ncbi:MAG: hypothetical protein SPK58_00235 [Lachnospiraceae bacterium]|nr:hypothetical protein [Lachnospiraceae bacterium]
MGVVRITYLIDENEIIISPVKNECGLGYRFAEELSTDTEFVFLK